MVPQPGNPRLRAAVEYSVYRFISKLACLTILPLLAVMALFAVIVWRSGAGLPAARIALLQQSNTQIGWAGSLKLYSGVKVARLKLSKFDVVVIGASRGGQIRSAMFKPYSFYNGSMIGWGLDRVYQVLDEATRDHPPKVVIFTIDFSMFSSGYEAHWRPYENLMPLDFGTLAAYREGVSSLGESMRRSSAQTIRNTIQKVKTGPIDLPDRSFDDLQLLGPHTDKSDDVFRHDGSMAYLPSFLSQKEEMQKQFATPLSLVGPNMGKSVDARQLLRMERIAALARRRGFILVGVQMPFPAAAVRIFDSDTDYSEDNIVYRASDRALWKAFETQQMREKLDAMGIRFFDLSSIPETNDTRLFVDLAHPGEYLALAAVIDLLKAPELRRILPKIDISSLEEVKRRAEKNKNYFDIFAGQY